MKPFGQESSQGFDKGQGLIEEEMMMGIGDGDNRSAAAEQTRGVSDDLRGEEGALFAKNHGQTARHLGQRLRDISEFKAVEEVVVEFPGPAPVHLLEGMAGDVRSEERRVGKECRSRWSP